MRVDELEYLPSYTTREARKGERNGIDYIFVSNDEFVALMNKKELLEIDQPHGTYYYGIPKEPILTKLEHYLFSLHQLICSFGVNLFSLLSF